MSKSMMWDLGIAGASALGAAFGVPPSLTSAAGGALKGQLYDEKNEAGYVDPNLIANQEAQYQANLSNLGKTGKVLKPITSYYGEATNLSSLTYKDSILMKTVSGVNTLGNKEDRITVGKDYKRGSYVPEYILEDMIRQQTGDEPKDSVQDYTKVKGFGKNKYVKPRKNK
jgi:hypothetical protein